MSKEKTLTPSAALTKTTPGASTEALLATLGLAGDDQDGFIQKSTGGITKWVDLTAFQEDPTAGNGKSVKGTGKAFAGYLMSSQEFEVSDEENGIERENGTKFRYVYFLRLLADCPVAYNNENKEPIKEIAHTGDIIAIGERHALKAWRTMSTDGGEYIVVVRPHSRIKIGGGRTMWTFDTWTKTVRQPVQVTVASRAVPF